MAGALRSMGFRGISGMYEAEFAERAAASWVMQAASMLRTDQPSEVYKWLGAPPVMEKWQGERRRQQLADYGLQVVNDKFEATVEVDMDDWRRDKTGQIQARIRDLAAKAATLPQRVLTPLIQGNGTGYDGSAFFSTTHSVKDSGTISNDISVNVVTPAAPTSDEMVTAILSGIQQMFDFKDDRGDPINGDAMGFMVMTPVKYWSATRAALRNDFTSVGVSNTLINSGVNIQHYVNPRLTSGPNVFYLFRTDAAIRALIWQDEIISDGFKTLGPNSENGFWRDSVAFGAKRIGQGALGRWELACRVTLT